MSGLRQLAVAGTPSKKLSGVLACKPGQSSHSASNPVPPLGCFQSGTSAWVLPIRYLRLGASNPLAGGGAAALNCTPTSGRPHATTPVRVLLPRCAREGPTGTSSTTAHRWGQ